MKDAGHLEKRRARDEIGQIQSGALESNGQANLRIDLQRKLIEMLFTQSSPHLLLNMQESHPTPIASTPCTKLNAITRHLFGISLGLRWCNRLRLLCFGRCGASLCGGWLGLR
jgi:hypothetical protein